MPKRTDIHKVLIIGSGPIIIGQACEFDYSGTQACKALKEEGYEVVLVNSNHATIMTDPGMADKTYIEPLTVESLEKIIEKERPDGLLPNLGGQTGLNLSSQLYKSGILKKYNVDIIGVKADAIERGEDRIIFKETMNKLGIPMPKSAPCHSVAEAEEIVKDLGFPVILVPIKSIGTAATFSPNLVKVAIELPNMFLTCVIGLESNAAVLNSMNLSIRVGLNSLILLATGSTESAPNILLSLLSFCSPLPNSDADSFKKSANSLGLVDSASSNPNCSLSMAWPNCLNNLCPCCTLIFLFITSFRIPPQELSSHFLAHTSSLDY